MSVNIFSAYVIMAYNLRTGLIGSGDIDVNVSLSGLTADNIQSGIFAFHGYQLSATLRSLTWMLLS